MTIKINNENVVETLADRVKELSGVDVSVCFQCKKCTSGCPVGKLVESPPSEIIKRLHLGAGDELLENDIVWMCASCETCYARCPMGIDISAVMDALRNLSLEKKRMKSVGNAPFFNRAFLETVRLFGRTYDLGMIAVFKIRTFNFFNDTEKFPMMLKKGKISLTPHLGGDKKTIKQIFKSVLHGKDKKP